MPLDGTSPSAVAFGAVPAGGWPAEPLEAPVLFLPVDGGAVVMVYDETCFVAVANRLPAVEPMFVPELTVCCTCYACSLTVPGSRCACASLAVSCSRPSWLLSSQAVDALAAIQDAGGPTDLDESG
jgi:hypothetical protein